MNKTIRWIVVVAVVLVLAMVIVGPAMAQGENPCEGSFLSCWIAQLQPAPLIGNCYVDGNLVQGGKGDTCWGLSWGSGSRKVEFREIEEPGNPQFNSLYIYDNVSKTIKIPPAGQTTWATLTAKKRYIRGILELNCNIQNYAGENVACAVTIDDVPQANIAAGQSGQYILDPGSHSVVTTLVGDPGQVLLWAPASLTQKVVTRASATPKKASANFKKAGLLTVSLDQPGVVGDFFLDGTQVGVQTAGFSQWVAPNTSHKVEVKTLTDPAAAGIYTWKDASQTTTVKSGAEKAVVIKLKKVYLMGFVDFTCDIKNYAGEDVNCGVTIDGVPQGNVAAGQKATYTLNPGDHGFDVVLAGSQAVLWSPATQSKTVKVSASATPKKLSMSFKKAGHLIVNLDQPGVVGDFYLDGVLIAGQAVSIDQWVASGSHKVEVKNLVDATGALWQDASQTVTVKSAEEKTVTIKLKAK
jgi:hypothetical protein